MELLIGSGSTRDKRIVYPGKSQDWTELVTVDNVPAHNPTVVHDLNVTPWPFEDSTFDEVHAYEILEHLGSLGDEVAFFRDFYEIWRVLKPDGILCATVPHYESMWAFGDPSHKRVINGGSLVFLDQEEYHKQIGKTPMSDFRHIWKGDFVRVGQQIRGRESFVFCLEAKKPMRTFA